MVVVAADRGFSYPAADRVRPDSGARSSAGFE